MQRADSFEKTLMVGKIEGRRRRGQQRMRWLDGITDLIRHEFEKAPGDGEGQGSQVCCSPWGQKESDTTERLNCTELNCESNPQNFQGMPVRLSSVLSSLSTSSHAHPLLPSSDSC